MSLRRPDRALRRAVAGLAELHSEDARAILDALSPGERSRIEALIADFSGKAAAPEPPKPEPVWVYEGVSPWLLARIDPDVSAAAKRKNEAASMTEAGMTALRIAAEPARQQAGVSARAEGRDLLSQAWRALAGTRR